MSSAQIKDKKIVSHLLMLLTLQKTWIWKREKDWDNTYTVTFTEHAKNEGMQIYFMRYHLFILDSYFCD